MIKKIERKINYLKVVQGCHETKKVLLMFYFVCQTTFFEITLSLKFNNIYEFILFVKESLLQKYAMK